MQEEIVRRREFDTDKFRVDFKVRRREGRSDIENKEMIGLDPDRYIMLLREKGHDSLRKNRNSVE